MYCAQIKKYQAEGKGCQIDTNKEVGGILKGEAGLFMVRKSEKAVWRRSGWHGNQERMGVLLITLTDTL